jgi:hypothetical protein
MTMDIVDAQMYGKNSNKSIENFVDRYITCDNDKLTPNLCETQTHCHKKPCRKKIKLLVVLTFHGLLGRNKFF